MACRCIRLNDVYIPIVSFHLVLILLWASSDKKNNTAESCILLGEKKHPSTSLSDVLYATEKSQHFGIVCHGWRSPRWQQYFGIPLCNISIFDFLSWKRVLWFNHIFFLNFLWLRYDLSLGRPKGHAAWHIIKRKPAQTRSLCRLGLTGKEGDPNQNIWHVEKQPYEINVKAGRETRCLMSWDQSHTRCPLQLLGTCWSDNLHSNHNKKSSSL